MFLQHEEGCVGQISITFENSQCGNLALAPTWKCLFVLWGFNIASSLLTASSKMDNFCCTFCQFEASHFFPVGNYKILAETGAKSACDDAPTFSTAIKIVMISILQNEFFTGHIQLIINLLVQIIALGASYFVAVMSLDIITNLGTIDDLTSTARIILSLPVAVVDALFIFWVFTSLSKTLNQLQARRASAKLGLYRYCLILSLLETESRLEIEIHFASPVRLVKTQLSLFTCWFKLPIHHWA